MKKITLTDNRVETKPQHNGKKKSNITQKKEEKSTRKNIDEQ